MQGTLSYRRRVITEDDLVFIRKLIAEHPSSSRRDLSKKLCEAWNWVQANGALRDMVCRGLMLMLHRRGPDRVAAGAPGQRNPMVERSRPVLVSVDETPLERSFAELGPLEVRQVRRTPEEALFNSLLQQHHYLGYTQPVGEHLKYLVYAQGRPIACVAWSSAPRHLGSRDRFIGWDAQARLENMRTARLQHAISDSAVGAGSAPGVAHSGAHGAQAVGRLAEPCTRTRSTSWRPSSIRSAFAAPATGPRTGRSWGGRRDAARMTRHTRPIARSSRCWATRWSRTSARGCGKLTRKAPEAGRLRLAGITHEAIPTNRQAPDASLVGGILVQSCSIAELVLEPREIGRNEE